MWSPSWAVTEDVAAPAAMRLARRDVLNSATLPLAIARMLPRLVCASWDATQIWHVTASALSLMADSSARTVPFTVPTPMVCAAIGGETYWRRRIFELAAVRDVARVLDVIAELIL